MAAPATGDGDRQRRSGQRRSGGERRRRPPTEDTPVIYTAAQLLGNDTDVDGDTLTIASVTSGTGGTARCSTPIGTGHLHAGCQLQRRGEFTYTVERRHGGTSNPATVTVNVAAVNDARWRTPTPVRRRRHAG